jgi:hypothetical protein
MQIPARAECFIWEFWSLPMSILDDPLDVAFTSQFHKIRQMSQSRTATCIQQSFKLAGSIPTDRQLDIRKFLSNGISNSWHIGVRQKNLRGR